MKKYLPICMAVCMALSAAACGNSEGAPAGTSAPTETTQGDAPAADAGETSGEAAEEPEVYEEVVDVNAIVLAMGVIPNDLQLVVDEINKITEPEIGVHLNIEMIEPGSYEQQINLRMSSAEKFDLFVSMPAGSASYNNMVSQNQLMDISDLLAEYAPEALELVKGIIPATTVGDAIYGMPTWRSLVTSNYICMRKDVLDDLGLTEKAQNMTSFAEYEEILEAVKASEEYGHLAGMAASDLVGTVLPLNGTYVGAENFADFSTYDQLGDTNKIISINPDGSDPTVKNNFQTDEYKEMFARMQDWYNKGYVYGDVTTQSDKAEELMKSNVIFSFFTQSEIGVETAKKAVTGYDVVCTKLVTCPISTSTVVKFVWAVPNTAQEPEGAVRLLNMMYTDSRIANLLCYGIEGTHYVVEDGIAKYPEGVDAGSCGYHTNDFMYGNQFLVYPWEGQSADFRDVALAEMEAAEVSAYLGFSADTTVISSEIAAMANVLAEYLPSIDSGVADQDHYDAFLEKMEGSGVQKIIDAYQTQLDEWLAANK